MEGLAIEQELLEQLGGHALAHEAKHEGGVGTVEFIADDREPEMCGVNADLVASARVGMNTGEGVAAAAGDGDELRFGGVAPSFDNGPAGVEFSACVRADGTCYGDGGFQVAGENGMIRFAECLVLNGALQTGSGFPGSGEQEHSAGLAIQAEGHAKDVVAEVFATGTDETGPRPETRTVHDDVRWLVEDEKVGSYLQNPAAEFLGGDEPSPICGRHVASIVDGCCGRGDN
ncbi:MAG: hypothetical protein JWN34_3665 [Bryobacterales bacterium]|nr:hypothetical protein [Bryobacterales bacterium]